MTFRRASVHPILRLAPLVLALLAACRPAVEEQAMCAGQGDFACPTGYHCSEAGRCVPGEGPPVVTIEVPPEELTGRVTLRFAAASPRGIAGGKLELRRDGRQLDLRASTSFADDTHQRATFEAVFETWSVPDGDYTLHASATVTGAAAEEASAERTVHISNGELALQISAPEEHAVVHGILVVTGSITSRVPLATVTVGVGPGSGTNPVVQANASGGWTEGDKLGGTFTAELDLAQLPEAEAVVVVNVETVGGVKQSAQRPVVVHNGVLSITAATATTVGPHRTGEIAVDITDQPSEGPTITAPGLRVYGQLMAPEGHHYTWKVDLNGATANVNAHVSVTSATGQVEGRDFTVPVDVTPPQVTGPVRLERLATGVFVSLACSEPASVTVKSGPSTTGSGNCGPDRTRVVALNATPNDRVTVVDEGGNEATVDITEVRDEDAYTFSRIAARTPGGLLSPLQVGIQLASPAVPAATLASADDQVATATTTSAETPFVALGRTSGPLRRTASRPLFLGHTPGGAVRFALFEGQTTDTARLTFYELGTNGFGVPLGAARVAPTMRPAYDAASDQLVWAARGQVYYGKLFGPATVLGAVPNFGLATGTNGPWGDSVVCGDRFVTIGYDPSVPGLRTFEFRLDGSGSRELTLPGFTGDAWETRLTCRGPVVQLFSTDSTQLLVYENGAGNLSWQSYTAAGNPGPRRGLLVSPDGLIGGGTNGPVDLRSGFQPTLYRFNGTWQAAGTGPKRAGGILVTEPDGKVLALGGIGEVPAGLVASSSQNFQELGYVGLREVRTQAELAWDAVHDRLVTLQTGSGNSELWQWTGANGWKNEGTLPLRHEATLVPRTDGGVYVVGGYTTSTTNYATSAFLWNGSALTGATAVFGSGMSGTQVADGRMLVATGSLGASTAFLVDAAGSSTRITLDLPADAYVVPTPGRDVATFVANNSLVETRVNSTAGFTPMGMRAITGLAPLVMPWAGVFVDPTNQGTANFATLPSATPPYVPSQTDGLWSLQRPCFAAPVGTRRSGCLLKPELEDPALLVLDDEPHPAMLFTPSGDGTGDVSLCARVRVGNGSTTNDVSVAVYAGNTVLRPAGTDTPTCRRFTFTYAASSQAVIAIIGNASPTSSAAATLELDEFVATRTNPK